MSAIRDFFAFFNLVEPTQPIDPPIRDTIQILAGDSYRQYLNHQAQAEYHASLSASYKRQFIRLNNDLKTATAGAAHAAHQAG